LGSSAITVAIRTGVQIKVLRRKLKWMMVGPKGDTGEGDGEGVVTASR
jgi:hypothetical protein